MDRLFRQEFRETSARWFKTRSLLIFGLVLFFVSVICAFSSQALIDLLGYEFSMIITIMLSAIIAGISAKEASNIHKGIKLKRYKETEFALIMYARFTAMIMVLLVLASIPLIVMILNSYRVINCNLMQGFWFYVLIPVLTGIVSIQLSMSFTLFLSGRVRSGFGLFILYAFITILFTAWKLYAGPRVIFFNFIFGTIVLFNYNQVVSIDSSFLLSRSISLAFGFLIFNSAILGYERNSHSVRLRGILKSPFSTAHRCLLGFIYSGLIVYLAMLFILRGSLGIDIDTRYVKSVLDGKAIGDGIILRYPSDSRIAGEADRLLKEHEWHYQRIVEELELKNPPVITSYIYPTRTQKTRLTGVGGTVFAKPWQAQIHVEYSENDIHALKHELTHILAGEFGRPVINISLQTGLCEGLSEAVEWESGALTLHQWAKEFIKGEIDHRASPLYTMRNEGFWSQRVTVAYYVSGSFVRWIIDTYGIESFKKTFRQAGLIFSDKPYLNNYGKTLRELTEEWLVFLETVPDEDKATAYAQYAFQRPAFVEQPCSREVADRAIKAQTALNNGQYKRALDDANALMRFQPDDPYHGWIKLSALTGLEMYDEALKLILNLKGHPNSNEGFKAQLMWRRGSILAQQERWAECRAEVEKTLENAIAMWMVRDSIIKLTVLDHESEELRGLMFKAMDPQTKDINFYLQQALVIDDEFWPAYYLIGRRLKNTHDYKESVDFLKRFLILDNYDPLFRKEGDLTLIDSAYRAEMYPLSYNWTYTVFDKEYHLTEAEKSQVLKWQDRIIWTWENMGLDVIELRMIDLGEMEITGQADYVE